MSLLPTSKSIQFSLFFGIAVAILILFLSSMMTLKASISNSRGAQTSREGVKVPATVIPTKSLEHFLTVNQPLDNAVLEKPNLTLAGKTSPNSTLVVIAGDDTQFSEVGSSGDFSLNLVLQEGPTTIEITSFNSEGKEQIETREVFYTTEVM